MMTGRLPSRIGAYDNGSDFPSHVLTLVHYLRFAGYSTTVSGKLHYGGTDQLHDLESDPDELENLARFTDFYF